MSLTDAQRRALAKQLRLTREREFDCDEFVANLAAWVDGGLATVELQALMQHHHDLCDECAEEYALLKAALDSTA